MNVKLYDSGEIFYIENLDLIKKSKYKQFIINSYAKIKEFSKDTFIIKYDNLIVYTYYNEAIIIGESNDYNQIILDLFYRNTCIKIINTDNSDIIKSIKNNLNANVDQIIDDKYKISLTNLKRALFSGGCFWCMAHPYYTFEGVKKVLSGYAGGKSLNPTYLETKHGNGYRETVLIVYDSDKITYKELLKLYFESIDPFDSEGQFIDIGHSYTTCVYYKDNNNLNDFKTIRNDIESRFNCPVKVALEPDTLFYVAEEEHQEFEFKFKERFEKEELISGRTSFKYVKVD